MSKDLDQTREQVTHQNGKPWTGNEWGVVKRAARSPWAVEAGHGSLTGHGGDFGFFFAHIEKPLEGFEGRMTWSGCILKKAVLAALREERG